MPLNRPGVQASIALNERLRDDIALKRRAFRQAALDLATWARDNAFLPPGAPERFRLSIDDALGDLFYDVLGEIDEDLDRDRRLIS